MRFGVVLALFLSTSVMAEEPWISKEESKESPFHATLGLEIPSAELVFNSEVTGQRVAFAPSLRGLFAIGLTHARFFGMTVGLPISQNDEDKIKQGHTDYSDFRFNFAFPRHFLQAGYSQYRGFFISNSGQVDNTWAGGPYLRADDLYKRTTYFNSTFISKPSRYSLESVYGQTARQVLSGGSWLWGFAAREEKISNPTAIIPGTVRNNYGVDQEVSGASLLSASVKGGYGYQHNFTESFFVNAFIMAGLGLQHMELRGDALKYSDTKEVSKFEAQLSLINNGKRYFGGFRGYIDNASYTARTLKIDSNFYTVSLFVGQRWH